MGCSNDIIQCDGAQIGVSECKSLLAVYLGNCTSYVYCGILVWVRLG